MNTERQGNYTVESDGKSVWINGLVCVARFGAAGYEFNNLTDSMFGFRATGRDQMTTESDWVKFVRLARQMFNVMVGDMHKPVRLVRPRLGAL